MRSPLDELGSSTRWGGLQVSSARGLPGRCTAGCVSPHWGYVVSGVLRVVYPDHAELIVAGDAYYVPPYHLGIDATCAEVVDFCVGPHEAGADHHVPDR